MVAGVIVTHGRLAAALLQAAEGIVGPLSFARAVCLDAADGMSLCVGKVHDAIDAVDSGDGVIILADLPGGTPVNAGLQCLVDRNIEIVTGVNLTMVVKLSSVLQKGLSLSDAAAAIAKSGSSSVGVVTHKLRAADG